MEKPNKELLKAVRPEAEVEDILQTGYLRVSREDEKKGNKDENYRVTCAIA